MQTETQRIQLESRNFQGRSGNLKISDKTQTQISRENRKEFFMEILRGFATRVLLQKVPIYGC